MKRRACATVRTVTGLWTLAALAAEAYAQAYAPNPILDAMRVPFWALSFDEKCRAWQRQVPYSLHIRPR